ncbi:MAG: hypothetical protein JOZ96_27200 [Acidobacteria bacterium]|nr:hypothetical protein [Acidobacteriota bacterium]
MTPQDHNKIIGIMHLIWGGFNTLMMLIMIPFFLIFMLPLMRSDPKVPPEFFAFFTAIMVAVFAFTLILSVPPLLAGYAMLKRKRWAKVMSVIAACLEAISMPFGTALAVYSLWFHFGPGQDFHRGGFDAPPAPDWHGLRDGSAYDWETQRAAQSSRPREYTPPKQPPDWRG